MGGAKLRWGILGTGSIAHTLARAVAESRTGALAAVGSRSRESAEKFAVEFSIPRAFGSYQALLEDQSVDAVYISTPHSAHAEWAVRCAKAGKHVLCEKPMTLCAADTEAVLEAAADNGVFLMEAFMYRCHPQTRRLVELVREKVVGEVRAVSAGFSFHAPFDPGSRLYDKSLGGGGILDVGCYPVSMARLIAGAADGKAFLDPVEVKGVAHLGPTGVDHWSSAVMRFPNGIMAEVTAGVALRRDLALRLFGTEGVLTVANPWFPGREEPEKFVIHRYSEKEPREVVLDRSVDLYAAEVDEVAAHLSARQSPAMRWADSLGNARALDQWRHSAGLYYEGERSSAERD